MQETNTPYQKATRDGVKPGINMDFWKTFNKLLYWCWQNQFRVSLDIIDFAPETAMQFTATTPVTWVAFCWLFGKM
jgi:hypothetical protein